MNKILIYIVIAVLIGWGAYFGLSRAFTAENLRVSFKGIKSRPISISDGITFEITLAIANPTNAPLRLDSIDLVGSYKGSNIGSTVAGSNVFNTSINPDSTSNIVVVYNIPITSLGSVFGIGKDVIFNIITSGLTFDYAKYFKGVVLKFDGIAKSSNLSVPFNFSADLSTL